MKFLVNAKRKMQGNLVCYIGHFISRGVNVFSLITVVKLKT